MEAQELSLEELTRPRARTVSNTSSASSNNDVRVLSTAGEPALLANEADDYEPKVATRWRFSHYGKKLVKRIEPYTGAPEFLSTLQTGWHRSGNLVVLGSGRSTIPDRSAPLALGAEEVTSLAPRKLRASPFEVIYDQKTDELSNSIARLRALADCDFANGIADRIDDLVSMSLEDEPDSFPLEPGSVDTLRQFMAAVPGISRPNIALTPSRTIQARWMNNASQKLSVEFRTGREVKFVLFTPDPDKARMRDYLTGSRTARNLARLVMQLGVLEWMSSNG